VFFFVDESGHTGANLFDSEQPTLYYGVLSSSNHLDYVAEHLLVPLRNKLGVDRLHAAELGNGELVKIADKLASIQKRFRLRFDLYSVKKCDHAVISFFDQVFDHGVNPAITWTGYWTPLRYPLLLKVAYLFDDGLARRAWSARTKTDDKAAASELVAVCEALRSRVSELPDARSRELIGDTLSWAIAHPHEISYNVSDKKQMLQVTPNIIGFQLVMHGIASRLRASGDSASRIIVDRQTQFNTAQKTLAALFARAAGIRMPMGPGLPEINFHGMPTVPIDVKAGTESAGLELTDIYLWLFKRAMENKVIAAELRPLLNYQINRGRTDQVSLTAIAERLERWDRETPQLEDMSEEQIRRSQAIRLLEEQRRQQAIQGLPRSDNQVSVLSDIGLGGSVQP
jgi:hypothetical protein